MKLSIYISHACLEYVLGDVSGKNVRINKAGKLRLDPVAVQKGDSLLDEQLLKEKIFEMKTQIGVLPKQIDVLLSATLVLNKLVEVPLLPESKLLDITRAEMAEYIDSRKEYIYDYSVLSEKEEKKKAGRISCVAIEREMYEKYMAIFKDCRLLVTSLDISLSAQINMLHRIFPDDKETYILGIMDGLSLVASLYVKGELVYNSSSRVSIRDNLGVISELIRVISNFIQFNKSQRNDTEVGKIYMVGLHEVERGFCQNIQTALSIETQMLPDYPFIKNDGADAYALQSFFYTTGNLFRK